MMKKKCSVLEVAVIHTKITTEGVTFPAEILWNYRDVPTETAVETLQNYGWIIILSSGTAIQNLQL